MQSSPFGQRHPIAVQKERQLLLGILLAGIGYLLPYLPSLISMIPGLRLPRALFTMVDTLGGLAILLGCVLAAIAVRSESLKVLLILVGALAFVVQTLGYVLNALHLI